MRGTAGRGARGRKIFDKGCGTEPGRVRLELRQVCVCPFCFCFFGGLGIREPYYGGYSGLGQEKDIYKTQCYAGLLS
jgi:hypothetical protein